MLGNEWDIVANHIRPAKDAAKRLSIPCVYATNSAPRIELQRSAFGIQREENVGQTLEELFAESVNDPLEYVAGSSSYIEHADVIAPQSDDYYIRKYVYSGFWDTRLDSLLRNLGIRTLVCAGFAADICLLGTMIDALYRNYKIVLLRDATQAVEIPEFDGTDGAFTRRIVLWTECHLGHTCTRRTGCCVRERRREKVKRSADGSSPPTSAARLTRGATRSDALEGARRAYDDQAYDEAVRRAVASASATRPRAAWTACPTASRERLATRRTSVSASRGSNDTGTRACR